MLIIIAAVASALASCGQPSTTDGGGGGGGGTGVDLGGGGFDSGGNGDSSAVDGGLDAAPNDVGLDATTDEPDAPEVIANAAPTVKVTAPTDGAVFNLDDKIEFTFEAGDDADAELDYGIQTSAAAQPLATGMAKVSQSSKVELSKLPAGKQTLTIGVKDKEGLTATATVSIWVNTAPGAAKVEITPAKPTTLDALEATIAGAAADVDRAPSELTYSYVWLRNGEATPHVTAKIEAGVAKKGETWMVEVTSKGPYIAGGKASASVVIGNASPAGVKAAIEPGEVALASQVTCTAKTEAIDADGDKVSDAYQWSVNGKVDLAAEATAASHATPKRRAPTRPGRSPAPA